MCISATTLSLTESELSYESLRNPYGTPLWPKFDGRDGRSTPMLWNDDIFVGFCLDMPWLAVAYRLHNEMQQDVDVDLVLHSIRPFIQWRRSQRALRLGDSYFIQTAEPVLAFTRSINGETLLAVFKLSEAVACIRLPLAAMAIVGHGVPQGKLCGDQLDLSGYAVWFAQVPPSGHSSVPATPVVAVRI